MAYGKVLASFFEDERNEERQLNGEGGHSRLVRTSFRASWGVFFGSVIVVSAMLYVGGGSLSGLPAFATFLATITAFLGLLSGISMTLYRVGRAFTGSQTPAARGDGLPGSVVMAALDSISPSRLVPLAILTLVVSGMWASQSGAAGFFAGLAVGIAGSCIISTQMNVMSQRVEVERHEVRVVLLGVKRTIPANHVEDIRFIDTGWQLSAGRGISGPRHIAIFIRGDKPIVLKGQFVADHERADRFVKDARWLLELDRPQDAPLPPSPQDAVR